MEWISVKDKLPEYQVQAMGNEFVIVIVCINGMVCEGIFVNGKWRVLGVEPDQHLVTHWMHYPEAPKS